MVTLSFGFKRPETGDTGAIVFPALEDNITQLNNHTHDGSNSSKINSAAIDPILASLSSAAWVAQGGGLYKQTVTLPGALDFDTTAFTTRLPTGETVLAQIDKVSDSQYDIWTNDNSVGFEVSYL